MVSFEWIFLLPKLVCCYYLAVDFTDSSQGALAADLSAVSCGSISSETEPEVLYTTIGAFHSNNFSLEDATRLSSVGVHLPSSALCALVTSSGHPLVSPTTEVVLETEKKHADDGEIKTISGIQVPVQQEQFVTEGLESTSKIDVSEFVGRSTNDDQDSISHHPVQARAEMIGGTVLEGNKLTGGFDLCITSMMSHITSEAGQEGSGTTTKTLHASASSKRSRSLDFRDVHPEDQFAPPAVIFQVSYLFSPFFIKHFSIECRKTRTKVITTASQNKKLYNQSQVRA